MKRGLIKRGKCSLMLGISVPKLDCSKIAVKHKSPSDDELSTRHTWRIYKLLPPQVGDPCRT